MRRLEIFPREKWRKKSWESLNLYAQIAHKLGLYNIKSELEDIAPTRISKYNKTSLARVSVTT